MIFCRFSFQVAREQHLSDILHYLGYNRIVIDTSPLLMLSVSYPSFLGCSSLLYLAIMNMGDLVIYKILPQWIPFNGQCRLLTETDEWKDTLNRFRRFHTLD